MIKMIGTFARKEKGEELRTKIWGRMDQKKKNRQIEKETERRTKGLKPKL
jgi:hypothetical protein